MKLPRKLSTREKGLLTAFLWVCLLLWMSAFLKGCGQIRRDVSSTQRTLKTQAMWLSNATFIKTQLAEIISTLDTKRSLDKNAFAGKVDEIARSNRLDYTMESPREQAGDIFNIFSLKLRFRNTDIKRLLDFEEALYKESPYLSLESLQIRPNVNRPTELNGTFSIVGMKLKPLSRK